MYKTKKDLDAHVRTAFAKIRSEEERNLRSFTIAKLYFKINEFSTAEQYLCNYLNSKENSDQAHKLLAVCYQRLKKFDKALQHFQRSLQLNPKQPDILADVCQLLLNENTINSNNAKYWCELAESENVQHESVFSLRLKLMDADNIETNQVEALIKKEISSKPHDVYLRVRLLLHYVEHNEILNAFKYVHQLEMAEQDELMTSNEWYNGVWLVLKKYEQMSNTKKDWEFWLIMAICLERQVQISSAKTLLVEGVTETANLLFQLDQYLFKITQHSDKLCTQKELVECFLNHYRGQLLLHTCALIFKRELVQNKNKWKETVRTVLPLLLLAYQVDAPDPKAPWIKHCDEQGKSLVSLWNREGSFRCAQAGRILLSCIQDETAGDKENSHVLDNFLSGHSSSLWGKSDDLLAEVRKICGDRDWRSNIFAQIFCNSDQKVKEQSSLLAKSHKLNEPRYELPSHTEVESYEDAAQYLRPQSLQHMVYLCLGNENLAYVHAKYFKCLNFSTHNLLFCGAESLNQLDMDSFLYATVIQAKRALEVDRKAFNSYQLGNTFAAGRPKILPFVNLQNLLCTEEQSQWWTSAYIAYKNFNNRSDMAEIRGNLQCGIEAVRGINGPKIDMAIVFKLGEIFVQRSQDIVKPAEKAFLQARADSIYKYGLNMLKMHYKGVLEPFRKYFKYANAQTTAVEKAVAAAAEDAVSYLAARYFKKCEYEELIEELGGLQLPFATYHQAEAYRKLDEACKSPKKAKRLYLDRASEYLAQTLDLLKYGVHADPNHPLNSVIHNEIKRVQQAIPRYMNDSSVTISPITGHNNSSTYEDAEADLYAENNILPTPSLGNSTRSRRETLAANAGFAQQFHDLESLVQKMSSSLSLQQEGINETMKSEFRTIKSEFRTVSMEISSIKEKIASLEESMKKTRVPSNPPSREDAFNVLDDLYNIDESLQQQLYQHQQQQQSSNQYGPGGVGSGPANIMPHSSFMAHQQRLQVAAFNSPIYPPAPNYPMNFYGHGQPYIMTPTNGPPAVINQRPPVMPPLPYLDPTAPPCSMNFSLPPQSAPLLPAPSQPPNLGPPTDGPRTPSNLYSLLQHPPVPITPHTGPASMPAFSTSVTPSMPVQPTIVTSAIAPLQPAPPALQQFHKIFNQPVEKGPPANVVITSSDPLPNPNSLPAQSQQQAPLSVTIPSHHIKPSLISQQQTEILMNQSTAFPPTSLPATNKTPIANTTATSIFGSSSITSSSTFSFKPHIAAAAAAAAQLNATVGPDKTIENLNKTSDSVGSDFNKSALEDPEYDPRPDFKPIIPLPDEIEVRTGEEDEEVVFCYRAKLFRHFDKDWKERGIGDIKILKNKEGTSRILMRREQTHKICANHLITPALILTVPNNETKGFIWVANDFADEELRVEKFYLRFKVPETAKQFEECFKNAQKEAVEKAKLDDMNKTSSAPFALTKSATTSFVTSTPATKSGEIPVVKPAFGQLHTSCPASDPATVSSTTPASKSLFTGLNLTTKAPTNETTKASEGVSTTAAPFANFTFGKTTGTSGTIPPAMQSPFASIFTNLNKSTRSSSPLSVSSITTTTTNASLNTNDSTNATVVPNKSPPSDNEEEYVPTAEFNPVIALPDLVEVNTGEENEDVLFEHRAKLLRFDKEVSEWKDRGLGNIKLLREKDNFNKVRLLMRREQVHKICCNQRIYKETQFKYAKNSLCALTWAGQDYSENELVTEMLTVRFKLPEICKQFLEAIKTAQAKMTDDKEENAAEKNVQSNETEVPIKGFGNAFKPKAGSWSCKSCYISNTADNLHCVACDSPKDDTVPKKEPIPNILATSGKTSFNFGFQFPQVAPTTTDAPKPIICFGTAMTDGSSTSTTTAKTVTIDITATTTKTATTDKTATTAVTTTTSTTNATQPPNGTGFGDAFKPKAGSWTCQGCYVCNTGDAIYCTACDAPKDDTIPKKPANTNVLALSNPTQKFSFGFGAATSTDVGSANKPTSGFSFNSAAVTSTDSSKSFTFTPPLATSTGLSSASESVTSALAKAPFNFSLAPKSKEAAGEATTNAFALDKKEFSFTLKPKSPGKMDRSPFKPGAGGSDVDGGANDDDGEYHEEEENSTYFVPVISLPDKIDVKTGEESEDILYIHRAKLFRFLLGEWKERGVGNLKILRHKETGKLRVVMRREQVHKICLNHMLNNDVEYKRKDERSWLFVVNDFSEGSVELEQFSVRFKSKDVAEDFVNVVRKALDGSAEAIEAPINTSITTPTNINASKSDPIISEEDKKTANELQLPYDLFTNKSACSGCRGCDPDIFVFDAIKSNEAFVSPEDTKNPLERMELPAFSISKSNNRTILKQSTLSSPSTKAEDTPKRNDSIFSGFGGTNLTALNNSVAKPTASTAFSFTTAFNNCTKPPEQIGSTGGSSGGFVFGSSTPALLFGSGSGDNKSAFGISTNTKLFDNAGVTSNDTTTQADKTPSTSIFGGTGGFGGISGGYIFGSKSSTASTVNPKSIFGSSNHSTQNDKIGQGNSIFALPAATNSAVVGGFGSGSNLFGSNTTNDKKNPVSIPAFADLLNSSTAAIGFDSLAAKANSSTNSLLNNSTETTGPGGFIGLTNQNDFSSFSKSMTTAADTSLKNTSDAKDPQKMTGDGGGTDANENDDVYDPHYEPIIDLPEKIVLSTGEEEETKLFGERGRVYRFDPTTKEWKERGVGEVKILLHPVKQTYRMVMRREQIHKLVLNHCISGDLVFSKLADKTTSFFWATINYAESTEGEFEKLAVRFKNAELAAAFSSKLQECIEMCKKRDNGN